MIHSLVMSTLKKTKSILLSSFLKKESKPLILQVIPGFIKSNSLINTEHLQSFPKELSFRLQRKVSHHTQLTKHY